MYYVTFVSALFMLLSSLLVNTSPVIRSSSQIYNTLHDSADKSDLEEGPVLYEAYYPHNQKMEQEKQLFYREPVIQDPWQYNYDTRHAHSSHVDSQYSYEYFLPLLLRKYADDRFVYGNWHSIESQKIQPKQNLENAFSVLMDTIDKKSKESIDQRLILNMLNNQCKNHLITNTYIEYCKLVRALINREAYARTLGQLLTPHNNAHAQLIKSTTTKENIFQPRPQVINYESRPPHNALERIGKLNHTIQLHHHDAVGDDNGISNSSQHPRIKFMKVRGESVHKIRHHHGERERQLF